MVNYKDLNHLGFVRPVIPAEHRSQVPAQFLAFVEKYEAADNRHLNVRGGDLIAVMTVLRSKPPTYCWKGDFVTKEMKNYGMGVRKGKDVMSCLNMSGWIRYLTVMNGSVPIGSVTEVMFHQLPQQEAGRKRIIRVYDHGRPKIFRKEGSGWVEVPDEDYPAKYVSSSQQVTASSSGSLAEPVAWVPSEWVSSGRHPSGRRPSEREAPPQYKEDSIEENTIEKRPVSPLSEKGDADFDSPGKEEESGAEGVSSPGATPVADNRLSAPGVATVHSRYVSDLVMLGRQSLNSRSDRLTYEEFVVDQLLPQLSADPTPPLSKWDAGKGNAWLATALVAQVILSLYTDGRWPPDVGRSFYKRARNLSPVDLKKILLGYDWGCYGADSVTSLFGSMAGTSKAEGWDCFIEKTKAEFRSWREEISQRVESLNLACENDFGFDYWLKFGSHGSVERVDDESPSDLKFWWLYFTGLHKQAAFPAGSMDPVRTKFERNRTAWRSEMAQLCAESRLHLSVVIELQVFTQRLWGFDLNQVRHVHHEWMDRFQRRARIYAVKVEKTFTSLFDFNSSATDADGGTLAPSVPPPMAASTSGPISPPSPSQGLTPCLPPFSGPAGVPGQAKESEGLDAASVFHPSAEDPAAGYTSTLRGS
jgi:hypothetical protein